jgi:putative tryptophan/tyrosine transport system substrate-binding protein
MKRREFITLIGRALARGAAVWPVAAWTQQAGKVPIIGVLGTDSVVWRPWITAFADRLRELGWVEGHTLNIEYRWSGARPERIADIAAEFVRQNVDVIVTVSGAIPLVRQATTAIPIVFAISVDPIGIGLITSLSRPNGNITGLSIEATDLAGKRLELLREVVPHLSRLAVIFHASYSASVLESHEVQAAGRTFGLEVMPHEIQRSEDIAPVFAALKGKVDALYVVEDSLVSANSARIIALTLSDQLPTVFYTRDLVLAGGLMSYGPNFPALFRRSAEFVDKILRGTKPADIPVEQPTKFELVINLKTAKSLGLKFPQTLLVAADEVIE